MKQETVAEQRGYRVLTVTEAKEIVNHWLIDIGLAKATELGLPEVDDRYHIWRVPVRSTTGLSVGEVAIDAYTTEILPAKTTQPDIITARLLQQDENKVKRKRKKKKEYKLSQLRNTIGLGDCTDLIDDMPSESIDLIFTSPPYFNARLDYSQYKQYETYLLKMRQVIRKCHRILNEGRFFAINISPVLIRRSSRSEASKRIAVPFDLHRIFIEEGYDFIDDIIWLKPEGAGWATGRGRRFAADRNPLQYKAVPVTEYILVYRKQTDLLIDWHIHNHPQPEVVADSKVPDGYDRTNVWKINPVTNSKHPAPFPEELAEKVITYYSFKNDVVLDPFAGSGTVGAAATKLDRRFVLFDSNPSYIELIQEAVVNWLKVKLESIMYIGCPPPELPPTQIEIDLESDDGNC